MDLERSAFTGLTFHFDLAAVIFDDTFANRQPQTQAAALLCRIKRLEDLAEVRRFNAGARIGHRKHDRV